MKKIAAVLVLILALSSCSKDNVGVINTELEGIWVLTDASCYCYFQENFDFSTHKISFQSSNLNVENSGETKFLANVDGSYAVDGNIITLENGAQYTYVVKIDKLELTLVDNMEIADDELVLFYEKY